MSVIKVRTGSGYLPGFTLTELLVVLIIIGILVLMVMPRLMPLISGARSKEAQIQLKHLYRLEKAYYMEHAEYSADMAAIGFEQESPATEGGKANYRIEIVEAGFDGFRAVAEAVKDFDGDGVFNRWEIDQNMNLIEIAKD